MNKKVTHKKQHRQNGFTLVELLFACVILGFMLTITLTTFIGVFRFYTWARTTRTTQEAARQVMNTMTREIQSRKIASASGNTLCLKNINPTSSEKSLKILLNGTNQVVQTQSFASEDCSGPNLNNITISAQNVKITGLVFEQVNGPVLPTREHPDVATSVTITMQVTNGTTQTVHVNGADMQSCRPADNFCDQASFTTAVMQR